MQNQDVTLLADRDRIMQVFINLLSNAIKFCEPGKGKIIVYTECRGNWYVASVQDNGHGIDPIYHALVFEKILSDARPEIYVNRKVVG